MNNKCYCNGQEDVYIVINDDKSITCEKCTDKCPTGCQDYNCGTGFYLDGCECKPVHYSCEESKSDSELECEKCKAPFEFVNVAEGKKCLCPCCSIEGNEQCSAQDEACLNGLNNGTDSDSKYGSILFSNEFLDSLKTPVSFWEKSNVDYTLLYRKSRDGVDGFKSKCANKGSLLALVKVDETGVIGGYTQANWYEGMANNDNNAFVFALMGDFEQGDLVSPAILNADNFYSLAYMDAKNGKYSEYLVMHDSNGQAIVDGYIIPFDYIDYEVFQVIQIAS